MIRLIDIYEGRDGVEQYLWDLMVERLDEGDTNISHVAMPSPQEHQAFIARRVYRGWYVVQTDEGEWVGAVYIQNDNTLGIVISKRYRRKGYARAALQALMAKHPPLPGIPSGRPGRYLANIREGNEASIALFKGLGATLFQNTYILGGGAHGSKEPG